MLNKLKNTFKHSAIYGFGNLTTKLIGLILLPLYTSHLSVAEYGVLSIFEITSQILVMFLGVQLATSMMRWYAVEKSDQKQRNIVFNTYLSSIVIQIIFVLAAIPFTQNFSQMMFGHAKFDTYFFYLIFWIALDVINRITFNLIRINEKSMYYIFNIIIKFTSILGLNIYFVAFKKTGIEGIILSQVIGNALMVFVTLPFVLKRAWGGKLNFVLFKEMFAFGAPLIISTVGMLIYTMSDRYLLKYLASEYHVGIYSLGYKISTVVNLVVLQSLQLGFLPIAYKMFDKKGAKEFFAKIQTYIIYVIFIIGIPLSLFSKEVIILFTNNEEYYIAYVIVPFLIFTYGLQGMKFMLHLGLHFTKKTKYHASITIAAAVVNIIVNIILIPYLHYWGAAITSIISSMVLVGLFYKYSQKFYPVKYEINRLTKLFVLAFIFLAAGLLISLFIENTWLNIFIKTLLMISFPIFLYPMKFYQQNEIAAIKGIWKKWHNPKQLIENFKELAKVKDDSDDDEIEDSSSQ